eukprot:COSAG01_NODE_21915_length_879_cov_3.935897_1_plen_248_part_10
MASAGVATGEQFRMFKTPGGLRGRTGRGATSNAPGGAPYLLPLLLYLLHAGGQRVAVMATQSKLVAADGASGDTFGVSVALAADGRTALVGASSDDDKGSDSGSAYVFERVGSGTANSSTSYNQTAKLVAADGASTDFFGASVALSADGRTALVGAGSRAYNGNGPGSAYVFERVGSGTANSSTSYNQTAKLVAADGVRGDEFGASVALAADGRTALVGAYYDDDKGTDSGSVYVFERVGSGTANSST